MQQAARLSVEVQVTCKMLAFCIRPPVDICETQCMENVIQMAPGLPELLLWRSASVAGFFLLHYASHYKTHLQRLVSAWQAGKLHVAMDPTTFK